MSRRITIFKGILWFFAGLGAAMTLARFTAGLGATTALSDSTPWGLWVGFDVMGGVALAAGGFVVAGIAHVFQRKRYHHAVRPAVLTAMLGYAAVAVGLLYDLGLPWNIWHPIIHWNPRSPLFEVAWCVMLYLTVLVLEFAPVFLERTRFQALYQLLLKLKLPLIILGIMLSTLHQSSLGSLLLIMPFRLHELWYTPLLPEMFFISAICLGLTMVIFESAITSWLYERKPETDMMSGLARLASFALAGYLALRLIDLARLGHIGRIFEGSFESTLFIVELALSTLIPLVLFMIPAVRRNLNGVFLASSCAVVGFLFNRINASGLAQTWATGSDYFPVLSEFLVSIGIVSLFALIFFFIQEHFPVDPEAVDEESRLKRVQLFELPHFDKISQVFTGDRSFSTRRAYSMVFVLAAALGLTLVPWTPRVQETPVTKARGKDVLRVGYPIGTVEFPHAAHIERLGKDRCGVCHHINLPRDEGTPCSTCHADMYLPTRIFDHVDHVARVGKGNEGCSECHEASEPHQAATARECSACHEQTMMSPRAPSFAAQFASVEAPPMRESMHLLCITCHKKEQARLDPPREDLARCAACHRTPLPHEKTPANREEALSASLRP